MIFLFTVLDNSVTKPMLYDKNQLTSCKMISAFLSKYYNICLHRIIPKILQNACRTIIYFFDFIIRYKRFI